MITLDFETKAIQDFMPLLPEPVGCAIRFETGISHYYSWGHPTENNCTKEEFRDVLLQYWDGEILTQNGATFDIPIAEHWFNLPRRDPLLTHDTLFLAYLLDPHSPQLGLKWLAENWLGMPPDDQQELYDWIMRNTECKSRKKAGAYISEAPGGLAGKYACSDVEMTYDLFQYAFPKVYPQMAEAYHRELQLAPILADLQNRGVRCDVERLERDTVVGLNTLHDLDSKIREVLKVESLSLDSDAELVGALKNRGFTNFLSTPTGKVSAAKDSLDVALADDPELRELLRKRATFATLTSTFMLPWLEAAKANGGRIHASYNQVRNPDGYGTRTGRLSSSKPNFQNVPGDLGPGFPLMRSYLLPEQGHVWVCGDFSNQEPRITAHFEDGRLAQEYGANPTLDPYLFVAELCGVTRKQAKTILLGIIYAMGQATMAEGMGGTPEEAGRLRNIIRATLPDVTQLDYDCKRRFQLGLPIRTLGGRMYHCEPPKNGRRWEYKALNTLIQGSAADQTKEALIYVHKNLLSGERILGTVHDEISISCPASRVEAIIAIIDKAANALPCDVPMRMDTNFGSTWADAK
jgi:DNA polymerase-1